MFYPLLCASFTIKTYDYGQDFCFYYKTKRKTADISIYKQMNMMMTMIMMMMMMMTMIMMMMMVMVMMMMMMMMMVMVMMMMMMMMMMEQCFLKELKVTRKRSAEPAGVQTKEVIGRLCNEPFIRIFL